MTWPVAEIDADEALARSLLFEQHPDLADLRLVRVDAGWDNTLWRLGDELLLRLPRRAAAAPLTLNEQRWLPQLAPLLPLPVPTPVRFGRPSGTYPWSWSIVPWLNGCPGDRCPLTRPEDAAEQLGRFLRALNHTAPAGAPHNPFRGVPLSQRAATFEDRLVELSAEVDAGGTRRVWERACAAAEWSGPPVWIHGDLHPANALVAHGTLAAVIDFGDICAGDPAIDLAGAWMLLPPSALPTFIAAYGGVDADLEDRSRGWAVLLALMLLAIGLAGRPTYATVGRRTLAPAIGRSHT